MKPNWSAAAALARALVVLGLSSFVGALVLPVLADGTLPMDWAHWKPVFATALGAAAAQELIYVRLHLAQAAQAMGLPVPSTAQVAATAAKALLPILVLVGIGMTQSGCLPDTNTVPVTPANQAQVSACESTALLHNDMEIGGFVFTGGTTVAGAAAAITSNTTAKNDLAVGAAVSGGIAAIAASIVGLSASNFASDQCSSVVGPLPATPAVSK